MPVAFIRANVITHSKKFTALIMVVKDKQPQQAEAIRVSPTHCIADVACGEPNCSGKPGPEIVPKST